MNFGKKTAAILIIVSAVLLVPGYSFAQDSLEVSGQAKEDTIQQEAAEQPKESVKQGTMEESGSNQPVEKVTKPVAKILIARQESDFKHAVALQTKKLLKEQNLAVECIDIKTLKKKVSKKYDAIVIINEVRAWHLNMHTRQFFDKLEQSERKKIIMVSTAKGIDWKTKEKDIDAVTVASEMNTVNEIAETVFKKIALLVKLD